MKKLIEELKQGFERLVERLREVELEVKYSGDETAEESELQKLNDEVNNIVPVAAPAEPVAENPAVEGNPPVEEEKHEPK
jgi:hypothetical protein